MDINNMAFEKSVKELINIVDSDGFELDNLNKTCIYHYCDTETAKLILNKKHVTFKMTEITDFEDKLEGRKTVLHYYKIAIDELLSGNKISEETYKMIKEIELSEYSLYIPGLLEPKNSVPLAKAGTYRTFVACFSTLNNDPTLMDEYIKRSDKKGYSIGLYIQELKGNCSDISLNAGFSINLVVAKYGIEIINFIKDAVYKIINNSFLLASSNMAENIKNSIIQLLDDLRYRVKSKEYEHENEVRIVAKVPLDYKNIKEEIILNVSTEGKNICFINLERYVFSGIHKSPTITVAEENEMKSSLKTGGYSWLK